MRRLRAHSISVARSPAGRNLNGAGSELARWRRVSAFEGKNFPTASGSKWRSCASAAEWNVRACTPSAPSAASRLRISPAALSVKVTARISPGVKAAVATWFAIRRVIVVVLPVPAPARMHTGPRTSSAARRCSGFRPARTEAESTRPCYEGGPRSAVTRLRRFRIRLARRRLASRLLHHRAEPGDELEGLAAADETLQLHQLLLEPARVDLRPRQAQDLRVHGLVDDLVARPQLL